MHTQRYGTKIRKLVDAATDSQRSRYECRKCGKRKVKRKGFSIWRCKSCNSIFAGGAYTLSTEAGELATRFIEEYEK